MLQWTPGCLCVCPSVCLCHLYSPNEWTDFDETFHKSSTVHLLNTFFSDFENSNLMTSWRPFCMCMNAALPRSQFCFDFLQILGRESKTSSRVCYLKLAKSVYNSTSGRKSGPWMANGQKWQLKSHVQNVGREG